ncbi:MAG: heavy metal translocating P-type ATPase, partial [Patescibacteria group bacterium]
RDAESLERATKVSMVVFDKTGTLTYGKPKVTDVMPSPLLPVTADFVLQTAGSAEAGSEHSLAEAIVAEARGRGLPLASAYHFAALPGRGAEAFLDGKVVHIGNLALMREKMVNINALLEKTETLVGEGKTVMYVALEREFIGLIAVSDTVKPESRQAVEELHRQGRTVAMITGDHKITAQAVARTLGIEQVLSEILPEQKAEEVNKLRKSGHRVAMVGDGINDAPALAAADIGIAMGSGTDVAIETAGVTLMSSRLQGVATALKLSKTTMGIIRGNLFWAFAYNVIGIPVAAGLLYPAFQILLSPMIAAAAMAFSSLFVVLNSLRLKSVKI